MRQRGRIRYVPVSVPVAPTKDRSQAAEGGTEAAQGEFTIWREGGSIAEDLLVKYTVATGQGQATPDGAPGADYRKLSGTAIIPAGQHEVKVRVEAYDDGLAGEGTEPVTITLEETAEPKRYQLGRKTTATVNILDRAKYFVYYYGTGGPEGFGDEWLDLLSEVQVQQRGYQTFGEVINDQQYGGFRENRGSRGVKRFFEQINDNGGNVISAAEAESADVVVAGWSLGASTAVNFAYDVQRVDKWVADYKLKAEVPVKALVTWDPNVDLRLGLVHVKPLHRLASVEDNVQLFRNYYQQRAGFSNFQDVNAQGTVIGSTRLPRGLGGATIIGNRVTANLPEARVDQVRVDTERANQPEERDRITAGGDVDPVWLPGEAGYRLYGNLSKRVGVNHSAVTWYAWRESSDALS